MSLEHAKKFNDKLREDNELREAVKNATEGIFKIAQDRGYHFTRKDLTEHLRERWGATKMPTEEEDPDTCSSIASERPSF